MLRGCTDSLASNYSPTANTDSGDCAFAGCKNEPAAPNYNPSATYDDGSCATVLR